MTHTLTAGFAVATLLTLTSCGGSQAPTSPSTSSPTASISVTGPAQAIPVITSWRCLTQSAAGTPGIFAAGIRDAACPAQSRVLVFDGALAAPGAPVIIAHTASGSTVTLTWVASTSPDPATSYVIEAGSTPGSSNIAVFDTLSTATSFTATGVPPGEYWVRVRARNSAGTSAASNEVHPIVAGGCAGSPNAPSGLTSSVSGSTVTFTWTAPSGGCAPTGYVLQAGSTPGSINVANFNTESTATTFSAAAVPAGTYYVRVRAFGIGSVGGPSNEVVVIVGSTAINVSGRWIGVAPDGVIFPNVPALPDTFCDDADDLQLDLTQVGTALSGTGTLRTRTARTPPHCSGETTAGTETLTHGTADGTGVSFRYGRLGSDRKSLTFSGVVSGNRMSGVVICGGDGSQCGTFAATRQ